MIRKLTIIIITVTIKVLFFLNVIDFMIMIGKLLNLIFIYIGTIL